MYLYHDKLYAGKFNLVFPGQRLTSCWFQISKIWSYTKKVDTFVHYPSQ